MQLEDIDNAINKKNTLILRNHESRRRNRLNPYKRPIPSTSAPLVLSSGSNPPIIFPSQQQQHLQLSKILPPPSNFPLP